MNAYRQNFRPEPIKTHGGGWLSGHAALWIITAIVALAVAAAGVYLDSL